MDENDPSIYAMENKTGWRIDGGKWKDVCSLAGCLIVISDIVTDRLNSYIKHHPTCKSKMQSVKIFTQWMLEWASNQWSYGIKILAIRNPRVEIRGFPRNPRSADLAG